MLVAGWAIGCGDDGVTARDAGVDAVVSGDARVDAAGERTIAGVARRGFIVDGALIERPMIDALLQTITPTPGGSDVRSANVDADGTFRAIVGAGASEYLIGFAEQPGFSSLVYAIDAQHPDFSGVTLGRPDAAHGSASVALSVSGLAPWGEHDDLLLISPRSGGLEFSPQTQFATPIAAGATAVTGKTFQWVSALPDAAVGDTTMLVQHVTKASGEYPYAAMARADTSTTFTVESGGNPVFRGALEPIAQDRTVTVHWQRSQFEALLGDAGPGAVARPERRQFVVDALPRASDFGLYASAPDLVEFPPPVGANDIDATVVYGNPFASAGVRWDELVVVNYHFWVPYTAPGATTAQEFPTGANVTVGLDSSGGEVTIAPAVSGVRAVTVAGRSGLVAQAGVSTTPRIEWQPPAVGTVSAYEVALYALSTGFDTATAFQLVAGFHTRATHLEIPDTLLSPGTTYFVVIYAYAANGHDLVEDFFDPGPISSFATSTAPFTP